MQLVLGSDVSEGLQANAVDGRYTVGQALTRMLEGTGLEWRYVSAGVIAIERAGQASFGGDVTGNRVFGTVRIEGAQNLDAAGFGRLDSFGAGAGVNGSSDPVSTEGTGSYTTNGSVVSSLGIPKPLQETTQSVTIMTNQRLEEQNLTDLNQVIDFTPGLTVQTNTASDQTYLSRGFEVSTFTIDGGAPISFSAGREGSVDLAQYDRVEILRGSSGFAGAVGSFEGSGGGIISLIRKRPLDNNQMIFELQGGSYNNYRVMADATGPLAFDGGLRGRVVLTAQDRDFFFDITNETRVKAYGTWSLILAPTRSRGSAAAIRIRKSWAATTLVFRDSVMAIPYRSLARPASRFHSTGRTSTRSSISARSNTKLLMVGFSRSMERNTKQRAIQYRYSRVPVKGR